MLSCLIRATTRTFVRVLVIALTLALFCGSFSWDAFARATDRRPCELPGDGEGIGGYKDVEWEDAPIRAPIQGPDVPLPDCSRRVRVSLSRQLAELVQIYLIIRK
jgi:hypothetical protein